MEYEKNKEHLLAKFHPSRNRQTVLLVMCLLKTLEPFVYRKRDQVGEFYESGSNRLKFHE